MATDTTTSVSIPSVSVPEVLAADNGHAAPVEVHDPVSDPIREHLAEWSALIERIQDLWPSTRHQLEFSIDPDGIDTHGRAHVTARIVGQPFCISDFPLEVLRCLCKECDEELHQFDEALEKAECDSDFDRPEHLVDADDDEPDDVESSPATADGSGNGHAEAVVPTYRPHAAPREPEAKQTAETVESPNGSDAKQSHVSGG